MGTERTIQMKIWVCPACGKWAKTRKLLYDVSCYIHAFRVDKSLCVFGNDGRVKEVRSDPE